MYKIDCCSCASELFSFVQTFGKMDLGLNSELEINDETSDDESNGSDDDGSEEEKNNAEFQETTETQETAKKKNAQLPSFRDALRLLCNEQYHLVDAYPELCKVYAIAVAVPVSSATSERSF